MFSLLNPSKQQLWQEDGAILSRVSGSDAYEAVLFLYATLGSNACNKNAVLDDLIAD